MKRLGNPVTIRDISNQPIDVEKALGPSLIKDSDGKDKKVDKSEVENVFKEIFGRPIREKSSEPTLKEYKKEGMIGNIKFWSTNEKPQK